MKRLRNYDGFSVVEILIVIIVLAVLGFIGFKVYTMQHKNKGQAVTSNAPSSSNNQSATADNISSSPSIASTGDLDKAGQMLDQNDPGNTNTSDSNQLDSQLLGF